MAKLLGVTTPQLSVMRDAVIERGLLAETDRTLSFAIPAMAQFVRERYARDLDVDIDGLREPLLAHIAERRAARAVRHPAGRWASAYSRPALVSRA